MHAVPTTLSSAGHASTYESRWTTASMSDARRRSEHATSLGSTTLMWTTPNGLPQPKAQTLIEKLTARGFGPDEAVLHFVGVVTNRCVASTLLHGVSLGYEAVLLEGGCCAADDHEQHADGVKNIREKGGEAVEVRP